MQGDKKQHPRKNGRRKGPFESEETSELYLSTNTSRADLWPRGDLICSSPKNRTWTSEWKLHGRKCRQKKSTTSSAVAQALPVWECCHLKEAHDASLPTTPWPRKGKAAIISALRTFYWPLHSCLTATGDGSDVSSANGRLRWDGRGCDEEACS